MPRVSFIVPIYNSMPYLETCLESLRNQSVHDIEIICVNDCSPDNSLEYLKTIATIDNRIKIVNHETNKRQGGAWNSGVKVATGDYLSFVDADDWVELDYCDRIPFQCEYDIIVAKNFFEGTIVKANVENIKFEYCKNDYKLYALLFGGFFITNFWKRTFLEKMSFTFIENNMYHDLITTILYFQTKNIGCYESAGYHYRTDNTSIQRSMNQEGFWGRLEVASRTYNTLRSLPCAFQYEDAIDFQFFQLFYRNSLNRCFYGYTSLPWDKIKYIKEEKNRVLPDICNNRYYKELYVQDSFIKDKPIILFETKSKLFVSVLHQMYIYKQKIRNILPNSLLILYHRIHLLFINQNKII